MNVLKTTQPEGQSFTITTQNAGDQQFAVEPEATPPPTSEIERNDVLIPIPAGLALGSLAVVTIDASAFGTIGVDDRFWFNVSLDFPHDGAPFAVEFQRASPTTVDAVVSNLVVVPTEAADLPATMFLVRAP